MASPGLRGKENAVSNLNLPTGRPRKPPSTNPAHHIRPNARSQFLTRLTLRLRNYAQLAEKANNRLLLLDGRYPDFKNTLKQGVNAKSLPLLRLVALIIARLSVEPSGAAKLADAIYLPLITAALEAPVPDEESKKRGRLSRDTARLAARAVRNMVAFSTDTATLIARNSTIVKTIIVIVQGSAKTVITANAVECAAVLANFARCGLHFQAYMRKHSALAALAESAATFSHPALTFHACRALAEYSLNNRWIVLLISHGCVNIMLTIIVDQSDQEIVTEATRFLGNLATSKVGREAILGANGVEKVTARIIASAHHRSMNKEKNLTLDLIRTASNLCVNCKNAAYSLIKLGGVLAFIEVYTNGDQQLRTEAFRGLLIIAQGGQRFRASVLRDIGIKIRQEASNGHCVAPLYDLSRRIRVEAAAEHKDNFPQTVAGLGARSKQYLFEAGPLATEDENTPNSLPDLPSPPNGAFRQSAKIVSVQRPVLHRERLEKDRRERPPLPAPPRRPSGPRGNGHSHRAPENAPPRCPDSPGRSHSRKVAERIPGRAASAPRNIDHIPRCKIVENHNKSQGSNGWVSAVLSAVCSAVTRPSHSKTSSTGSRSSRQRDSSDSSESSDEDVYEIGVALGRGGFATVYLAKNLRTSDLVAVKRFHPINSSTSAAKKKAEMTARRAVKEQRIWDGLSHKNVVSYRGCFFGESGELNLVAEYIPGWSLADHLSQVGKFPEHMVACITQQIVDGLDYLHKCGVTHRDVKPANILVNPDGVIKITDFGVSSAVDVPTMTGNTLVGTPWYIAPEMIEGRPYGKSVDIWSLGCTVIELASGRRPYHNLRAHVAMFRMTRDRMPPIPKQLSTVLRDFLKTCWVWDPAQRPTPANLRRHPFLASVTRPEAIKLKNMARKT